ncbi:MAG: glycoside hydrolase family 2 protein [Lachnospiraceae bacterium]|nr:glycoside hydrolase family 2 protein [Lachnospiraceae bacterium]
MTKRVYLNNNWGYTENYSDALLYEDYDDSELKSVRLPHTCKETPFHYFDEHIYQMVSGYRRILTVPEEWRGKKVLLTIDGAAHESEVFLNGSKIGEHHCGYTAFTMDITEKLKVGEDNILVIKVNSREDSNIPPFGFVVDYMTYGGIYREVYLDIKEPVYLQDIFVRTDITGGKSAVISQITLNEAARGLIIRQSLKKRDDAEYKLLGEYAVENPQNNIEKTVTGDKIPELKYQVENASLWDIEHPNLYEIKTELIKDGEILDERIETFGFRKAEFRADGFYLNNKKVKIRGLNRHQSFPYVGYAMPESMQKHDADILKKELGVNAVRTSHYPQSHYFLDRCDEIGLLVFTEIPGWQHIGDDEWKAQAVENVRDMVLQYRNHTSIILWGVRINESLDDDEFYQRTNAMAHELDPYRATGGVRAHKKSSLLEDVYTYNDFLHDGKTKGCERKADVTTDMNKAYLISEYNGHMYPTKAYDWEEHRLEHAMRHANVLDAAAAEEDIAGSFGWCMFDYNTHKDFGSGDRICYHGVMDMFRNPKLAADIYACEQEEIPVLFLSSSMDIGEHPGCNRGNTYILTNADSVRMYKNDRFIKEYTHDDSPYRHLKHGPILIDDFIGDAIEKNEDFKPAQAEAIKKALNATARYGLSNLPKSIYLIAIKMMVIYHMKPEQAVTLYNRYIGDWGGESTSYRYEAIKNGKVIKEITKQPATSIHIHAEADHYELVEKNTYDVAAIRIRMLDEYGNQMNFYNGPVFLETDGPIEIIGPKVTALQGGMGGTYVRTQGTAGEAIVKICTTQTEEVQLKFVVAIDNCTTGL